MSSINSKNLIDNIIAFTDGSCIKNKLGIFCGYGVHFPNKELTDISRSFEHVPLTNQRTELYAIYKAIKKVCEKYTFKTMTIYSDSEYSIKSLTIWIKTWKKNGWKTANKKPVLNIDLIQKIDELIANCNGKILFTHVRAHTGLQDDVSKGNDVADTLAKNGASKMMK